MRNRVIHLINPKTDSLTTRPLYLKRALYSPLAGLIAVAAAIPRDPRTSAPCSLAIRADKPNRLR